MLKFFENGKKILGMNSRNLSYIRPCNLSKAKRLADDKILSKKFLKKAGIPVPKMIAKISSSQALEKFDWSVLPASFALKPSRGFGGEGILVVYGKKKPARPPASMGLPGSVASLRAGEALQTGNNSPLENSSENFNQSIAPEENASFKKNNDAGGDTDNVWIKADGSLVAAGDLKNHVRNILDGSFSLSGVSDTAFFEERLKLLKLFKPYAFKGIPDIRVIVYNKVPIMAMLRLPTKDSGGKANLQQGAIGVGIDLASGITTTAVQGKFKMIEYAPETRLLLSGIKIPYWPEILKLAVQAQEITGLGFLGADIAIDKDLGPVFLELNARPGLSIQIANLTGLKERLDRVRGLNIKTIERGVKVGMNLFGGEIEEELEEISGRKIVGTVEKVKLIGKEGKEIEVEAKIDTGAGFSSIDAEIAKQLGFEDVFIKFKEQKFPEILTQEEARELNNKTKGELIKNIPGLVDTAIIHSATGTTYRPMVRVEISMQGLIIPAKVSIIDRSGLKQPVIIGKKNLGRFLIDVNK